MLQPTPNLTFRLSHLRHFKIHPPLPLTPRESTQLLNLLTTSFRQQLDREHGTFPSEAGSAGHVPPTSSPSPNLAPRKRRRHPRPPLDIRTPTDHHFLSILTNPLFKDVRKKPDSSGQQLRDPMEIFDETYAKGFMKIEYATACLKAKKKQLLRSSIPPLREAMKSSGAGSKALRWIFSSSMVDDISFLNYDEFSEILIDFLVAEGLQPVVWRWLETLCLRISAATMKSATVPPAKDAARLLLYLIKAEASRFISLDSAFATLRTANDMLDKLHYGCPQVLAKAGRYLCNEIVDPLASHPTPSPELFDFFLSIVPTFYSQRNTYLPRLLLHHPTKPDASLALDYLRGVETTISASIEPKAEQATLNADSHHDSQIIDLGLHTARYLFEHDQFDKAHWVMNFLQERYAKQLGISQKKQFKQAQAEASSLELLNNLNLT